MKTYRVLDEKHDVEAWHASLKTLKSYGCWSLKDEDVDIFDSDQLRKMDTIFVI